MTSVTNEQIRMLLLGRLAPEEVARLEAAILMEEGVAERLREEEFDLIDDYARGNLAPSECADMERYVLTTPEQMESLQVARALAIQLAAGAAASRPASVTAVASATVGTWRKPNRLLPAAALLAAGLAAVAVIPHWGAGLQPPSTGLPSMESGTDSGVASSFPPEAERSPDQTIILLTDTSRGGSKPVVHLASDTDSIRVQAEVPGPTKDHWYSMRVDDAAGASVFEKDHLAIRVAGPYSFVEAVIPAKVLGSGARTISLTLEGTTTAAPPEYRWRIDTVKDDAAKENNSMP